MLFVDDDQFQVGHGSEHGKASAEDDGCTPEMR